jgi:hypothetical protein
MTKAQEAAAATEADKNRQEAIAVASAATATKATVDEKALAPAAKAKGKKTKEAQKANAARGSTSGIPTIARHAQNTALPQGLDDWELYEGDLPEGSSLSGSKALLEKYPEDEANSKKTKKTNTGKGKNGNPITKA